MSDSPSPLTRHLGELLRALGQCCERDVIYATDSAGRLIFWSKGLENLLELPAEQALGRDEPTLLGRRELPRGHCENDGSKPLELTLRSTSGKHLRVCAKPQTLFDAANAVIGRIWRLRPEPLAVGALTGSEAIESFHGILTCDPAMKHALQIVRNVAETDTTVLVRGESGTGKELVARAIHEESSRRDKAFLAINCASITASLLESELFGHVRGAFTGALKDHAGMFQRADGGTLFLDEIAELPMELQAKLLRVLQERTFIPVGGERPISVDVRIVAATHQSLREQTKAGRFREDLMYRLRVVPIFLPPLRIRHEDLALLLRHFIDARNVIGPRHIIRIDPGALRSLMEYAWPGNIRELKNVVEYAFAVGRGEELTLDDLPPEFSETAPNPPTAGQFSPQPPVMDEADAIRQALRQAGGHIDEAARALGMSRATFWRKRKKYAL